ncbi:MAG: protein-L-isoaspartate O-methyltransferase [Rhodobacteraceae bacterium]|nr:protein-L-isoaspartate O-methyltransferase [Paracoccaceae bacterium]
MTDFAARRVMMVDTQVRPSDVTKFPIIEAMLHVPRERFVPAEKVEAAYVGENLSLGGGRVLLDPRTLAKMLDFLEIGDRDLVLDVACGTGYSTAVIGRMAEAVVGVESDADMAAEAQANLSAVGADNALVVVAAPEAGHAGGAPYDAVIVQGGVEVFPEALAAQLKEGGRAAAVFMEGALGVVRIGLKRDGRITWRDAFNAGAPVLPGFGRAVEFTF